MPLFRSDMKSCCKEVNDNWEEQENRAAKPGEEPGKVGWLTRLKGKWQVKNILQVILILCTFALGGTLCAFLGRHIKSLVGLPGGVAGVLISILLATILWPLCVLLISIPLGQFRFFRKYLSKLGNRMFRRGAANKE